VGGGAHGSLRLPLVDGHLLLPPQRDIQLRTKTVGHTFRSQGWGGQAKSSKQRVMEWREEGAPLPPPLPIRGSLYSQIKPNHFTGPRKPGRCAPPPASLPRQNSGQGEGAVVFFFFFSFLNFTIVLIIETKLT